MTTEAGAWAQILWDGATQYQDVYVSYGERVPGSTVDSFGVNLDSIDFFTTPDDLVERQTVDGYKVRDIIPRRLP